MTPERVLSGIAESMRRSPCGNTPETVLQEVIEGRARIWIEGETFVISQPLAVERVWHAFGAMDDLGRILLRAEYALRASGTQELMLQDTRNGWARVLAPLGFEQFNTLVKTL